MAGSLRIADTVPPLSGRALLLFRVVWTTVLLLALVVPLAGALHFAEVDDRRHYTPFRDFGLRGQSTGSLLGQPFGAQAKRAGIVRDSTLLAIDGTPVPPGSSRREMAARLAAAGPQAQLVTRTPDGEVRRHLLTRDADLWARNFDGSGISRPQRQLIFLALGLLTAAIAIFAAVLLMLRRPRDPVAALFSLGLLCQAASAHVAVVTWFATGAGHVGAILHSTSIGALTLGVLLFPQGRFEPRWSKWLAIPIILWTLVHWIDFGLRALPATLKDSVTAALFLLSVAALLIRFRRLPMGAERQQVRWALLGFALGIGSGIGVLANRVMFQGGTDEHALIWASLAGALLQMLLTLFIAVGLLVSLLRYRLYDAEAVISRSAGYAVLTVMLGGIFAASAKGLEWAFERNFGGDAGALPGAIGAGVAVVLITPLHDRIHRWAERRFQKALLHLRRDLPPCVDDLRETASLNELARAVLFRVSAGIRAEHGAILIGSRIAAVRDVALEDVERWLGKTALDAPASGLNCDRDDSLFPMRVPLRVDHDERGAALGWMLLGPRPDGSFYGKDEREALASIADPVARAVQIAGLREAREQQLDKRLSSIEKVIAEITNRSRRRPQSV